MGDHSFADLLKVISRLRDPQRGCPWTAEQDFDSIAPLTLEELYELLEAVEQGDVPAVREELGDLLMHLVLYAQIASEAGQFDMAQVIDEQVAKLVRRHAYVFTDGTPDSSRTDATLSAEQVRARWEEIKRDEPNRQSARHVLGDLPMAAPALARAQKLQDRAAALGFDFPRLAQARAKLDEELGELDQACAEAYDRQNLEWELGDVLFSCVNLARHLKIDAERAAREAGRRFERRFQYIAENLAAHGKNCAEASLEEMDALWEKAKRLERQQDAS